MIKITNTELSLKELKERAEETKKKKWAIVYEAARLPQTAEQLAQKFGVSSSYVTSTTSLYNTYGTHPEMRHTVKNAAKKDRRHRALFSLDEEICLLRNFLKEKKEMTPNALLAYIDTHSDVVMNYSTVTSLLHRHGYNPTPSGDWKYTCSQTTERIQMLAEKYEKIRNVSKDVFVVIEYKKMHVRVSQFSVGINCVDVNGSIIGQSDMYHVVLHREYDEDVIKELLQSVEQLL